MGRGKVKKCASKWHKEWKSSSAFLINLKDRLGGGNVFRQSFKLVENSKTSMCLFRLFTDMLKEVEFH